jgi:hypothetical protein
VIGKNSRRLSRGLCLQEDDEHFYFGGKSTSKTNAIKEIVKLSNVNKSEVVHVSLRKNWNFLLNLVNELTLKKHYAIVI